MKMCSSDMEVVVLLLLLLIILCVSYDCLVMLSCCLCVLSLS